jgi:hypothetical protein
VAAIILLALTFSPSFVGWGSTSPSELWFQGSVLAAAVFVGFLASKNNISGPLRFGLHQYNPWFRRVYKKSPDWTVLVLLVLRVLLPWTQMWLIGALSVSWQYTLQYFREAVRGIADKANNLSVRAAIAATQARDDSAAASRYEQDALSNVALAIRDARQSRTIKTTDFFAEANAAWVAIEAAAQLTSIAAEYSDTAANAAQGAYNHCSHLSSNSASYAEQYKAKSKTAADSLNGANANAQAAKEAVARFRRAQSQDEEARKEESENSTRVTSAVKDLNIRAAGLPDAAVRLTRRAEQLRYQTNKAIATAEEGRVAAAQDLLELAVKELDEVEKEADRIASEKVAVRKVFISQILDD